VGLAILRAGGNAVDAAVATALALAVVHPEAGNLGGGGFALVKLGDELAALDFRETAPAAATARMYLDEHGEPLPEASTIGPLAAGVPGSPAGYHELHRRFGKLPWAAVVAPAARLARSGFTVSARTARSLAATTFDLARFPASAALWLPGGKPLAAGTRLTLPELAMALDEYGAHGPAALTAGPRAAALVDLARRSGGILTLEDLASYRPVWREPLVAERLGWQVATMPLPSSGGVIVLQALALLERLGYGAAPRFGAERAHLLAEVLRRAFADRTLLGDPGASQVAPAQLLDPAWLARRAAGIDRGHATASQDLEVYSGRPLKEGTETTQVSVVDGAGGAVALTTTLNELFGGGFYVPGFGFLNDEMDDFTTAAGRPNLFGLIQGEANAIAPGRRPLSSMSPTILWSDQGIVAAGGRGGSKIPTGLLQMLLNLLLDGDPLQAAVDRPRLHHQGLPDRLEAEADALAPETRTELERRGHTVVLTELRKTPKINVARCAKDGLCEAAADSRGPGGAGAAQPGP